jgi:hypothetical protein
MFCAQNPRIGISHSEFSEKTPSQLPLMSPLPPTTIVFKYKKKTEVRRTGSMENDAESGCASEVVKPVGSDAADSPAKLRAYRWHHFVSGFPCLPPIVSCSVW